MTELDLMWLFMAAIPKAIPTARPFRRTVVNVEAKSKETGRSFRVRAGIQGQSDIYVLVKPGRIVEVETKARRGVLSPAQKSWQSFCLSWGIPHLVLRELPQETAEQTVSRWVEELRACIRNAPEAWELAALSQDQTA